MADVPSDASAGWVGRIFRDAAQVLRREERQQGPLGEWAQGATPGSGPSIVILDGYLSRSEASRFPPFTPLLVPFGQLVAEVAPGAAIHGFSYYKAGRHYARAHTQISPLLHPNELFAAYAPRADTAITYLAYSLGGLVATLGLGSRFDEPEFAASFVPAMAPRLVLCQPAFALAPDIEADIAREPGAASRTLLHMSLFRNELLMRLGAALRTIVGHGVDVQVLVWTSDQFLSYGE